MGRAKGEDKEKAEKKDKMMSVEEREEGSVSWRVYWEYIVALGTSYSYLLPS